MRWKRLVIPPYVVPGLWIISVVFAIAFFYWQQSNSNLAIFYTLSLASAAAFLAAWVGMSTYFYINKESQDRGFRRGIEIRYFEEIYGPLYEEVWKVYDQLKNYGNPFLEAWPKIRKSRFEPVIDQRVKDEFLGLSHRLTEYGRQAQPCWDAAARCIQLAINGNEDLKPLEEAWRRNMIATLQQDSFFMFDDAVDRPNDDIFLRLDIMLGPAIPDYKREDAEDFVRRLKPILRADPVIADRNKKREALLESVSKLGALVLERMRPFHETE